MMGAGMNERDAELAHWIKEQYGDTAPRTRRKKTHCKRGHALTSENLYFSADGTKRRCKECTLMHTNARHAALKGSGDE